MDCNQGRGTENTFCGKDEELSNLPDKLQKRLLPFQREGVKFALSRNGRCMIADEMGLGKTLQAISVAYLYRHEWPLLIVVPSSLKYPWIEEMEHWIPELGPGDIFLVESKTDIVGIGSSKVTVLGYGLLTTDARTLVDALTKQHFQVVLVDESHYLKSRNAARSKILVPIIQNAKRAILLTGTPALGRPEELFMQIDALYPRRFGMWTDYAKKFCNAHFRYFGNRRQWDCRGASHLDELHRRLNEIMIRRRKDQVLSQLPPKIRQRIPFDLPKDKAKEASASLEEWERLMKGLDSGTCTHDNPFVEVMGLITHMYKQTAVAKAGAVKDYIKMMLENDKLKFLVFAHHLTMLQACTEAVIETKAGYIRIDGSVPSSERIQLVHRFQNDPDTRVAILSIQAAGQGLTFTAATHVVFAELYWNPGHVKQAEDRAHRIGQNSSVHIHYLIAKGTFDTVMWSMLNRKETVTGSTLNGKKEYLEAEIGDKDKWDFLNFAQAWTPNDALTASSEDGKTSVFFSHFEKDRQHDIRTFFSPCASKEKKRKRTGDETSDESDLALSDKVAAEGEEEAMGGDSPDSTNQDEDFAPQVKRLKQATPLSRRGGKRVSLGGSRSPLTPLLGPRRLSGPPAPQHNQKWSCSLCTFSNSGLMLRCEMCESPRSHRVSGEQSSSSSSSPAPEQHSAPPHPPTPKTSPCVVVVSDSDAQHDDSPRLQTRQTLQEDHAQTQAGGRSTPTRSPTPSGPTVADQRESVCNSASDTLPLYDSLKFCASRNTDRIYIYDKDGSPLHCNFVPLDITLQNWEDLPVEFSRPENRRAVVRFVREWNSLTAMKQRLVRRSGRVFTSPVQLLEQLTHSQRTHSSTKRYITKADVAQSSLVKAQREGGSVRIISKEKRNATTTEHQTRESESSVPQQADVHPGMKSVEAELKEAGYVQAVDSTGVPLCLSCQKPCLEGGASESGFCSSACQEELRLRSYQSHMRTRVLEAEQGVCQHCGLNAHELYLRIKDAPHTHRKQILESTWLAQLPLKQLNDMIRNPVEGQFWQVDHIRPVYSGGGQCLLDNLQTLCTVCHRTRTSQQASERSIMKKGQAASKLASDITRFFYKK